MSSRTSTITIVLALLILASPGMSQTSGELRRKYGAPATESYEVRKNIIATLKYDRHGKPTEIIIAPINSAEASEPVDGVVSTESNAILMAPDVVNAIINELVPVSRRGSLINEFDAEYGAPGVITSFYEHVTIHRLTFGPKRWISSVRIVWEDNRRLRTPAIH